ncbi:hypothetical protein NDU88_004072 [Pleurodeles waltl]|uniref:Uncharacterized protein n=1 Tax=Pleurodeles waltl TaxID=8319 RepID=A0AAV7W9A3_PLEWA|nr:hypothetical protein NDU88_004072 [Pleurodeles waltl]
MNIEVLTLTSLWGLNWFLVPGSGDTSFDNSAHATDSDKSDDEPRTKKRKSHHSSTEAPEVAGRNLLFEPENILYSRSTEWVLRAEVAHYVQEELRKSFEHEVCNTLRSECPRPSLLDKVGETPELDPNMATFLCKFANDPKKGLDCTWRRSQDKLLDLSGPLTKILELAVQVKENNSSLDLEDILDWAQQAI